MDSDNTRLDRATLRGPEITGCRHRLYRRMRGDAPDPGFDPGPWRAADAAHRAAILAAIPGAVRIDEPTADDAHLATLEALAVGADVIAGGVLQSPAGGGLISEAAPDLLVKLDDAPSGRGYLPIMIVGRRLLADRRPRDRAEAARVLPVERIGRAGVLGRGVRSAMVRDPRRQARHHAADAVRAGQMADLLDDVSAGSGLVGGIGADPARVVVHPAGPTVAAYRRKAELAREVADGRRRTTPRKVRGCADCEYSASCHQWLVEADDISLVLPGDLADRLRGRGVTTVTHLAEVGGGPGADAAAVGRARLRTANLVAGRLVARTVAPRATVEIDVDVEAYPGFGAYLWGAWDGAEYRPFAAWRPGDVDDAFRRFWSWLTARRAAAPDIRIYCWGASSENHWLHEAADRCGGGLRAEVDALIRSDAWVDMQRVTRRQVLSVDGLGLKTVAPMAGFTWHDPEAGGAGSLPIFRIAAGLDDAPADVAARARELLLRYNADDCRATAVVRDWLSAGTDLPEVPR